MMLRATALALLVSVSLCGCTSSRETAASIEVIDGCMVKIVGISSERAGEITKSCDFDTNCELEVKSRLSGEPDKEEDDDNPE